MKISLINPNLNGEFRVNIGIAALATYIDERTKHKVQVIDVTFHRMNWGKYVKKKIKMFQPDVIGVSALSFNFYDSINILNHIFTFYKPKFVIFGGTHPTLNPIDTLKIKYIDAIVIGEGEYVLEKVLNRLERKESLKNIKGLWYKDGKKIIQNPRAEFIQDLDSLPFPNWRFFEIEKYKKINPYEIPIFGSRGCPFDCTYCLNHVLKTISTGKYIRYRSAKNIIEEMKFQIKVLKQPDLQYFYFWDDMFNLNTKFVQDFAKEFINSGLSKRYSWACSSRIDTVKENQIKLMAEANLNMTRMGVEAGSPYIRQIIYRKNFSNKKIIKVMELLKKYNIKTQTDFIIGGPKEEYKDILQTFSLIRKIKPDQISLNIFQPYPQLEASKIFIKDGGKIDKDGWKNVKTFLSKSPAIHNRISYKKLKKVAFQIEIIYIISILKYHLPKQKLRLFFDVIKFLIYDKWKYRLLWHDLFKISIRKYIYEENLSFKKII